MGLVFVPTPLGNLRDITLRALDTLRDASLIVAEDSRVARRLLSAYEIPGKEIWTYHEHNAAGATENILARAREAMVAVVTDAGMPGISDPGVALVAAARAAGVAVDVLPGGTAFACAAVLSGFDVSHFAFDGFPPRTSRERRAAFTAARERGVPSVWYEAPHRIAATLDDLAAVAPDARIFLVRELSKLHEQQLSGTAAAIRVQLDEPARGEIAFVLDASDADRPAPGAATPGDLDDAIDALIADGLTTAAIAKRLASEGAGERQALYARVGERRARSGAEPQA